LSPSSLRITDEVVEQRLHVRVELRVDVAGQETEVAVRQRHDRARQQDLPVALAALEGRGEREQRLAGAGLAGERHELTRSSISACRANTCSALRGQTP
jgi:hypothetical protein